MAHDIRFAVKGKREQSDPTVKYFPPSQGPFKCGNCEYFQKEQNACKLVSGFIEAEGCCNLYEKDD
jgi:hypothetical protein